MRNNENEKMDIDFKEYTNNQKDFTHDELVNVYKQMIVDINNGKYDSNAQE